MALPALVAQISIMNPHLLGRCSETLACEYLESHGWLIVARNYRSGHKEIDIIARRRNLIAFVEVKARAGDAWGHPLEAITWSKRREIGSAARAWIRTHGSVGLEYRFDAIAICWTGSSYVLDHVPHAWVV